MTPLYLTIFFLLGVVTISLISLFYLSWSYVQSVKEMEEYWGKLCLAQNQEWYMFMQRVIRTQKEISDEEEK